MPDFALGPHTASLGLAISRGSLRCRRGSRNGMFVGQHGSWNRKPRSGYKVVFVPFANGSRRVDAGGRSDRVRDGGRRGDGPSGGVANRPARRTAGGRRRRQHHLARVFELQSRSSELEEMTLTPACRR